MIEQWFADPAKVGASALMLVAIFAFYKGLVVPRWSYDAALSIRDGAIERLTREKDEYRAIIFQSIGTTEQAIRVADKATTKG
jgi:hypothetical protein